MTLGVQGSILKHLGGYASKQGMFVGLQGRSVGTRGIYLRIVLYALHTRRPRAASPLRVPALNGLAGLPLRCPPRPGRIVPLAVARSHATCRRAGSTASRCCRGGQPEKAPDLGNRQPALDVAIIKWSH